MATLQRLEEASRPCSVQFMNASTGEGIRTDPLFPLGGVIDELGENGGGWRLRQPVMPERRRILVIDDDPGLRLLLRTTLAGDEFAVEEASSAEAAASLVRSWEPTLVILDIGLPGASGLAFCRELKHNPSFGSPAVILLTGADTGVGEARNAGADALLRKPFSPVELVGLIDGLPHGGVALEATSEPAEKEQLIVYARDLGRILQAERTQRRLLQRAYRATVTALADALEARDPRTGTHALRVQRYAVELTEAVHPSLLTDASLEYGFLLHDIGKIAIPDQILNKPGPLTEAETRVMRRHPVVGTQILGDLALLDGHGIAVVRSHHERWDGCGYPDHLSTTAIPIGARIFAVADALDAMTSDRPYRTALPWPEAAKEISAQSGCQFDPGIVDAFTRRQPQLRHIHEDLMSAA